MWLHFCELAKRFVLPLPSASPFEGLEPQNGHFSGTQILRVGKHGHQTETELRLDLPGVCSRKPSLTVGSGDFNAHLPKANRPFDLLVSHVWSIFGKGPKR